MRDKTEVMGTRLTKREAKIVEAAAKAEGVNVSEYLRSAALTTAVIQGNADAVKLVGRTPWKSLWGLLRRVCQRVNGWR